jgi:hypothetical protein
MRILAVPILVRAFSIATLFCSAWLVILVIVSSLDG